MLTLQQVIAKSQKVLDSGLHPTVREGGLKLIEAAYRRGVLMLLIQGFRTHQYQAEIYAQGRTKPGDIVTNCPPTYSPHEYGLAIDFVLLDLITGSKVLWNPTIDQDHDGMADWMEIVAEAKKLGFAWGGDFKSFVDKPHLEMMFGLSIRQLRDGKKPLPTAPAHTPAKSVSLPNEILKEGSTELSVGKVQEALKRLGYYDGKIDTFFGPKTEAALRKFQEANNLDVDGIYGKFTKKALEIKLIGR